MEARAVNKYIRQSAKKVKPVLDMVRGKKVNEAINMLNFMPKKAAKIVSGTAQSAVSNLLNNDEAKGINPDELIIKKAFVDQGPVMKRIRPRSMGRAYLIRKRSCHVTIVVGLPKAVETKETKEDKE